MEKLLDAHPQPEWNTPSSVSEAILSITSASNQAQALEAYDCLLYALGNNHAGTYFPIALATLPKLATVLASGSSWAQQAALNVLVELTGSFAPEPGYEHYAGLDLAASIHSRVLGMRTLIQQIAKEGSVASASANDLLEQILPQE
jgi:hypothetical protein